MARDWTSTDLLDPCILINQSRRVSSASESYHKARGEFEAASRMSKVVFSSIRTKIKKDSKEKLTQDDLTSEVYSSEDWLDWLKTFNLAEKQMIESQVLFEKENLKWKSIQSAISFMKTEMTITKG